MTNPIVELLQARYGGRAIATDPLPDGALEELIEAARLTPSCRNCQPWRFLFAGGEEALAKARAALAPNNHPWASRAPLLIIAHARREDDCHSPEGRDYYRYDLGAAVMNIMLAATARGLAARPIAGFDPAAVQQSFELADDAEPLVMLAIGHPTDDESHVPAHYVGKAAQPRERLATEEIVKVF